MKMPARLSAGLSTSVIGKSLGRNWYATSSRPVTVLSRPLENVCGPSERLIVIVLAGDEVSTPPLFTPPLSVRVNVNVAVAGCGDVLKKKFRLAGDTEIGKVVSGVVPLNSVPTLGAVC